MTAFPTENLSTVCEISMGQAPKGESYNTTGVGYPLIAGAGDFGELTPTPKKFTDTPTKLSRPGDLILCIRATIGNRNWSDKVYCLGRGVAGLSARSADLCQAYLGHWIDHVGPVLSAKGRGATFLQVSKDDIASLQIPLPPLAEQKRIAAILDAADALRTKRRESLSLLDALLQSTFLDMFGDPVTNPMRWDKKPLGEIVTLQRGFDLPVQNRCDGCVPIFAANGPVGTHNIYKVKGPGVVTGRSGTLGKVHYASEDFWPLNTALWAKDFHGNNPIWTCFLLKFMRLEQYTRGVGVPTLNRNLVHVVEMPLPPLNLQLLFADIVSKIEAQKDLMRMHLAELDTLFAALQQRAFNGELST